MQTNENHIRNLRNLNKSMQSLKFKNRNNQRSADESMNSNNSIKYNEIRKQNQRI